MPGLPDNYLRILYEGGVSNCSEGALRLFLKNKGGSIWVYGLHNYYLPPGAMDETREQNLGQLLVEGQDRGSRWDELTLGEIKKVGFDSTETVIRKYSSGEWELQGGKPFQELLAEYGFVRREKGF